MSDLLANLLSAAGAQAAAPAPATGQSNLLGALAAALGQGQQQPVVPQSTSLQSVLAQSVLASNPGVQSALLQALLQGGGGGGGVGGVAGAGSNAATEMKKEKGRGEKRDRSRSADRQLRAAGSNSEGEQRGLPGYIGDGGRLREDDDEKKLGNKIKQLGCGWQVEAGSFCPRAFRISLCTACHSEKYDRLRFCSVEDETVDLLIFCLTALPPDMKMIEFGTMVKGSIRAAVRRTHRNLMRNQPNRLQGLSGEFENVAMIAIRCGLPPTCLSPRLTSAYQQLRSRAALVTTLPDLGRAGHSEAPWPASAEPATPSPAKPPAANAKHKSKPQTPLAIANEAAVAEEKPKKRERKNKKAKKEKKQKKKEKKSKRSSSSEDASVAATPEPAKKKEGARSEDSDHDPLEASADSPVREVASTPKAGAVTWKIAPLDLSGCGFDKPNELADASDKKAEPDASDKKAESKADSEAQGSGKEDGKPEAGDDSDSSSSDAGSD